MKLVTVKIIVLALSGLVRIFFGLVPLVVMRLFAKSWTKETDRKMKKVISVLMFFGGGVLLATCFLHMMPEVRESFREAEPELELPLSEIIFLAGFFLVYMIEDIVHSIVHQRRSRKEANNCNTSKSNSNANQRSGTTMVVMVDEEDKDLHNNATVRTNSKNIAPPSAENRRERSLSLSSAEQDYRTQKLRETKDMFRQNSPNADEIPGLAKNGISNGAYASTERFQYCDPDWLKDMVNNANPNIGLPRGRLSICNELMFANIGQDRPNGYNNTHHNNHQHHPSTKNENNNNAHSHAPQPHSHRPEARRKPNRENHSHMPISAETVEDSSVGAEIRNILIVVAISFHGIFEGMAIGLQGTSGDVWYLFMAVSLHECTILFCIGVELISSNTKVFRMVLYILIVSLVSPVGIVIGIIISEKSFHGEVIHQALIIGCFQGLAAGTLLYVTFFEIFQEEGRKLHRKCYHILIAVLGFVLMGSLEFMGGHNHGDKQKESPQNISSPSNNNTEAPTNNHSHDHGHTH